MSITLAAGEEKLYPIQLITKQKYHYIHLPNQVNDEILYTGASGDIVSLVSTIEGLKAVYHYLGGNNFLYYIPDWTTNTLMTLEYGKTYQIVVGIYPQDWVVPINPYLAVVEALNLFRVGEINYAEMEQAFRNYMTTTERPFIEMVDLDFNHNGILDNEDRAMLETALGTSLGQEGYERRFDLNFNDSITSKDLSIFDKSQQNLESYGVNNIQALRDMIRTGEHEYLIWPSQQNPYNGMTQDWVAYIIALNNHGLFTGADTLFQGWISLCRHPYIATSYVCSEFSADTAIAAYKALGYGTILRAISAKATHAYNIYWTGGDWRQLSNWHILEPQNGQGFNAAEDDMPEMYQTGRIEFFSHVWTPAHGPRYVTGNHLIVDYPKKTVRYAELEIYEFRKLLGANEEPCPLVFNRGKDI